MSNATETEQLASARLAAANTWLQGEVARLRLTDAEREAIAWAASESDYWAGEGFNSSDDPRYAQIAATLRGLLERTK